MGNAELRDKLQALLEHAKKGADGAVLFACMPDADGKDDAYYIQCISHRDGAKLKVDREVRHVGFGLFMAYCEGGRDAKSEISFDGGGAMRNVEGTTDDGARFYLSWSPLRATQAQLDRMGYDPAVQITYLENLLASLEN